jgi:hypothetical protein
VYELRAEAPRGPSAELTSGEVVATLTSIAVTLKFVVVAIWIVGEREWTVNLMANEVYLSFLLLWIAAITIGMLNKLSTMRKIIVSV